MLKLKNYVHHSITIITYKIIKPQDFARKAENWFRTPSSGGGSPP